MTIDGERLPELAAELGFWPATTGEADIERHRQQKKNADYWLARRHRFDHLRHEHDHRRQGQTQQVGSGRHRCPCVAGIKSSASSDRPLQVIQVLSRQ